MVEVVIAEPGELGMAQLDAAEALVRSIFGSSFRSRDWLHAVEGAHVVLTDSQALVAFAAVVNRTLHHNGAAFDTGHIEGSWPWHGLNSRQVATYAVEDRAAVIGA